MTATDPYRTLKPITKSFDRLAFRVGHWYGFVLVAYILAEETGAVSFPSVWFVLTIVAIVIPSAPALFRLSPLWRNYFVPFTGPAYSDYDLVGTRFVWWTAGGLIVAVPVGLSMKLLGVAD